MANSGVTGRVVFAGTTNGIPDLFVSAVDIDPISSDDILGTTVTDANGNFSISYNPSSYRIWGPVDQSPDIEVRIFGEGDRLLSETKQQANVEVQTLDVGIIEIHKNNFRVPQTSTIQQRKQDNYWFSTHTSLDPANGTAIRLTLGNQIDWLVDGAAMFPEVTNHVDNASTSVKFMNMGFDPKDLISDFDFGAKTHQTVEKEDLAIVRRLGTIMVNKAAAGVPVDVLVWDLEDIIGGIVGGRLDQVDDADEVREFFQTALVRIATLKTTQLLHVKLIVVDGEIGYITGSSMKQGYFGDQNHLIEDGRHGVIHPESEKGERQLMHDVSLRVRGPSVRFIDETFSTIWNTAHGNPPAPAPQVDPIGGPSAPVAVQVLRTLPGRMFTTPLPDPNAENLPHGETGILESYQRAIMKAEEFIYIEDQYFNSREIATALKLRMAEMPELEVILVLNARPDIGGYHRHQTALLNELRDALGSRQDRLGIFTMWTTDPSASKFQVAPIYVHSKVAIVDDSWASVGTANVDGASMNQRQWRLILPGLLEKIDDLDDLKIAMLVMWLPILFLVLLVTSPLLLLIGGIRHFLVDAIRKEFVRGAQHANPNREQQPLRHCEINLVLYNDIAGQPQTDKVKELRENLWKEMLGAPPPTTRPAAGWVSHWKKVAADNLTRIRNSSDNHAPSAVTTETKILEYVSKRDYEEYLRSLNVKTKNIVLRKKGSTMPFEIV